MQVLVKSLIALIALQHVFFCTLEMFLWKSDFGRKVFKTDVDFANRSSALAANQGLYNLFLAGGLFYSLITTNAAVAATFQSYFLACVVIAGLYGAFSVSKNILLVQAIPALITLVLAYIA